MRPPTFVCVSNVAVALFEFYETITTKQVIRHIKLFYYFTKLTLSLKAECR